MPSYGYAYIGRVLNYDTGRQGYYVESVALAPNSRWGPVPSCVPGLVKGDRVVMVSTGTSRDNLLIIAKVGAAFPDIGSIPGLQAALDAKLDDSQLDQANGVAALDGSRKVAYTRLPIGTVASTVAAGDDARMTNARTPTAHASTHATGGTDPITAASIGAGDAAVVATNNANIAAIAGREEFDGQKYFRLYGDAVTTMPRYMAGAASASLTSGNAYAFTLSSSKPITMLNAHLSVLTGGGATVVASIYQGTTPGSSMSLVSTGPTVTSINGNYPFQCAPTSSPFVVNAGYVVALLQIVSGSITVGGSAALDATMLNGAANMRVAGYKALTGSPPSTINTADGTWSYFTSMPWVALD